MSDVVLEVPLRREILTKLAEEAERTMPDLAESSDSWVNRIREGYTDAVLVMVLAWTTQLKHLHLRSQGFGSSVEEALLGRCVSRLPQLRTADIDVALLLEFPKSFPSIPPDFLASRLSGSLRKLAIDWHHVNFRTPSSDDRACLRATSWRILGATCTLLQEAGPGRKFSKLRYFEVTNIIWWPRQSDGAARIGRNRGVDFVINNARYGWNLTECHHRTYAHSKATGKQQKL
jgi:hypothetical protein